MNYPVLAYLPDGIFTNFGLGFVFMTVLYIFAEGRNIRRSWSYRWLNADQASIYFYEKLKSLKKNNMRKAVDDYALDHDFDGSDKLGSAFPFLLDAVNDGAIQMKGLKVAAGIKEVVPVPLVQNLEDRRETARVFQRGSDGHIYSELEFSKHEIEKYIKSIKDRDLDLKQARRGNIEAFIKEHEADPDGDLDKLDALIKRPTQESEKATRPASSQASDYD